LAGPTWDGGDSVTARANVCPRLRDTATRTLIADPSNNDHIAYTWSWLRSPTMWLTATHCLSSNAAANEVEFGDRAVGVQVGPVGIERQCHLIGPAMGVEVNVRIGDVGPRRRHRLGAGGRAVIPLNLVVRRRNPSRHGVGAEGEVVVGAVPVEEELRRPRQVLAAWLHGDPGLRPVGVQPPGRARPWPWCT
jgi:hypothetical protein